MKRKMMISILSLSLVLSCGANGIFASELTVSDNNIELTETQEQDATDTEEIFVCETLDGSLIETEAQGTLEDFVERSYSVILGRDSDASGKSYWSSGLKSGAKCGSDIVVGFIKSDEYQKKNKSNSDYVEDLYKYCLGRQSDSDGKAFWLSQLASGKSRDEVMAGFVNSKEFTYICGDYDIARGTMKSDGSTLYHAGANAFIERCYGKVLGRQSEPEGREFWAGEICSKGNNPQAYIDASKGFVFSPEFINKKLGNEAFVEVLYQTFLGRASDSDGKAFWCAKLANGAPREEIIEGFANSKEFSDIIEKAINNKNLPIKTSLDPSIDLSKAGGDRSPSGVPVGTTVDLPGGGTFYQGNGYQVYSGMGMGDSCGEDDDPNLPWAVIR